MKKTFYIITFLLLISSNVYSHDWKHIETSETDDEYYLDTESVKKINGNVQYWVMVNYSQMLGEIAYSAIAKLEGDCYFSEIRVLKDKYYSKKSGNGKIVSGSDKPDGEMQAFPKDTMFGIVLKEACNLLN